MAGNLIALATVFRSNWDQIKGKTGLGEETIERAGAIGVELLQALGSKDVSRPLDGDAARSADIRARALTLLVKRYDQVRRAVEYLRWDEGDANEIAPSIYLFRRGRRPASRAGTHPPAAAPGSPPVTP